MLVVMKSVFVDIDTQMDFVFPTGALYVPGAELILDQVVRLNRWAAANNTVVISTMDAHAEDDPEFQSWPAHCVAGTLGQRKPAATLLERRIVVPTSPGEYAAENVQQIIIEKQQLDCFTNPNLPGVLERLGANRFVVYGVVTEYCVQCAAMGLLRSGKRVELVTDAVKSLNNDASRQMIEEFVKAGGVLTTVGAITG
jgi:nicotinamidase/pyrazinamidase